MTHSLKYLEKKEREDLLGKRCLYKAGSWYGVCEAKIVEFSPSQEWLKIQSGDKEEWMGVEDVLMIEQLEDK